MSTNHHTSASRRLEAALLTTGGGLIVTSAYLTAGLPHALLIAGTLAIASGLYVAARRLVGTEKGDRK